MKTKLVAVGLSMLLGLPSAHAGAPPEPPVTVSKFRYQPGGKVVIRFENHGREPITLSPRATVYKGEAEEVVGTARWDRVDLAPGDRATAVWRIEDRAREAGFYLAEGTTTTGGGGRASFLVGEYFTLGFRSEPDASFVVFAAKKRAVRQMRAQARAEDKTMIVSGIVQEAVPYNPPWSYAMDPRTIHLNEVFIEVCDGNPYYVEEHHDEWMGQRWCPWSSYVAKAGR